MSICFARPVRVLTSALRVGTGAKGYGWHSYLPVRFCQTQAAACNPTVTIRENWTSYLLVLFQVAFGTLNACLDIIGIR